MNSLKTALKDWQDSDVAQMCLADCLGLAASENDHPKGLYWTNNRLSRMLHDLLERMVRTGVLQESSEGKYRWNPSFPPSLEQYYSAPGDIFDD
jgi:hypothetical protein